MQNEYSGTGKFKNSELDIQAGRILDGEQAAPDDINMEACREALFIRQF